MTETPDLTLYKLIHRGMRADTARMAAAVTRMTEADRATRVPALRRWYHGFLGEFEMHHTVEDEIFFPALADRVPVFADQIDRLEAEHHRLEAALDAVGEALGKLADPNVAWGSVRSDAVDALAGADNELTMHLDFEDADVLPLFVRHMSVLEYEDLGERAEKRTGLSHLTFSVPWVVSQTTPEEKAGLLAAAALPMKVLWYATRGRYDRLATRALGGAVATPVAAAMA
jgi:hypothetical protein